jgi:SprT protein
MKLDSDDEITDFIADSFLNMGLHEAVHWKWNGRFKSSLGRAIYDESLLELSSFLWPHVSAKVRRTTILHEACHIGAFKLFNHKGHGTEWEQLMIYCGENPQSHHFCGKHLNKVQVFCDCDGGCRIGKIRHSKMLHGKASYACNTCDKILRLVK